MNNNSPRRKALNSNTCREAEALEAFMLDPNAPEEKKQIVRELISELASLTSMTLAHPRLIKLAYREMVHADRQLRPDALFHDEMTPEELSYEYTARRILTQLCDVIDPQRAWAYNKFVEYFH